MIIVYPITSNLKEFPTHYILKNSKKITGAVLCEYVRSIDYKMRKVKFVEKTSNNDFNEIVKLFNACVEN